MMNLKHRENINADFNLNNKDINALPEKIVRRIVSDKSLHYSSITQITTALLLDEELLEDTTYYPELEELYSREHEIIPVIGLGNFLKATLGAYVMSIVLEEENQKTLLEAVMSDYIYAKTSDDKELLSSCLNLLKIVDIDDHLDDSISRIFEDLDACISLMRALSDEVQTKTKQKEESTVPKPKKKEEKKKTNCTCSTCKCGKDKEKSSKPITKAQEPSTKVQDLESIDFDELLKEILQQL